MGKVLLSCTGWLKKKYIVNLFGDEKSKNNKNCTLQFVILISFNVYYINFNTHYKCSTLASLVTLR